MRIWQLVHLPENPFVLESKIQENIIKIVQEFDFKILFIHKEVDKSLYWELFM